MDTPTSWLRAGTPTPRSSALWVREHSFLRSPGRGAHVLCPARGRRSEAGTRCWVSVGEDACGRDTQRSRRTGLSAVPASVSCSVLCHTCYQHTLVSDFPPPSTCSSPEPMSRPWRPAFLAPRPCVQLPQSESSGSTWGSCPGPPAARSSLSPSGPARPSVLSLLSPSLALLLSLPLSAQGQGPEFRAPLLQTHSPHPCSQRAHL